LVELVTMQSTMQYDCGVLLFQNVSLKPNLSAILDGLLEQMMMMVDAETSSPHVVSYRLYHYQTIISLMS